MKFVDDSISEVCCSFCGKGCRNVGTLIEGPHGNHICRECVDLYQHIFKMKAVGHWEAHISCAHAPAAASNAPEMRSDGKKNAWMPLISIACIMVATWIGLPCLFLGSFGWIGLLEGSDGVDFLLIGISSLVPGVLLLLFALRQRKMRRLSA